MDVRGVWSRDETPVRVWGFVERLLDEPWSRYRAHVLGGESHWREHLGWGPAEYLAALHVDAVQANTSVTAVAGTGRRPRRTKPVPRPTRVQPLSDGDLDELEAQEITPGADFFDEEEV